MGSRIALPVNKGTVASGGVMGMRWWVFGVPWLWACSEPLCGELGEPSARVGADGGGNVLVVLVDDVGVESVGPWGVGPAPASMPVLDCLCDRGLRLTQTWSSAVCSPTRGELQTGRYSRRLDLGGILRYNESGYALPTTEDTLGELARREGYAAGLFGKWHLGDSALPDALTHPNRSGYDRFAGTMGNLANSTEGLSGGYDYDFFQWVVDGEAREERGYVTSRTVDDALTFVDEVGEQPWLVVLSFHAPHVPLHAPPADLVVQRPTSDRGESFRQYQAMLQAVDRELGRFLRGLDATSHANTTILWMADNGTVGSLIPAELGDLSGKASLAESGIRVPAVIAGLAVDEAGARETVSDSLTHVVDVYPTVAELIGGTAGSAPVDGRSWLPLLDAPDQQVHTSVASAQFGNVGGPPTNLRRAIRTAEHKLLIDGSGVQTLHEVGPDRIDDGPDLMQGALSADEQAALVELRSEMAALEAAFADESGRPIELP